MAQVIKELEEIHKQSLSMNHVADIRDLLEKRISQLRSTNELISFDLSGLRLAKIKIDAIQNILGRNQKDKLSSIRLILKKNSEVELCTFLR